MPIWFLLIYLKCQFVEQARVRAIFIACKSVERERENESDLKAEKEDMPVWLHPSALPMQNFESDNEWYWRQMRYMTIFNRCDGKMRHTQCYFNDWCALAEANSLQKVQSASSGYVNDTTLHMLAAYTNINQHSWIFKVNLQRTSTQTK